MRTLQLLPWFYGALSLVTYAFYAHDKSAARRGTPRVRERTLQLLALAGGWPGALLAQHILRHKTRKTGFLLGFRACVLLNVTMLLGVCWHFAS